MAAMVSETVISWQIVGQPPRLPNCENNIALLVLKPGGALPIFDRDFSV
jgi:hypothetical protein